MKIKVKKGSISNPVHERKRKQLRKRLRYIAEQKNIAERRRARIRIIKPTSLSPSVNKGGK